ncbi:hypothetical protein XENOCAPTIV_010840 [Xenoophorus captivus]|uniref:Ubiquitin-like protease family profile domain-containing protein n=1 Tax=Xenoophorus captivus TaxID=1517983 RepID=A0ABV0QZZ3_9TELE
MYMCIVRVSHPNSQILSCFILDIRKAWDGMTAAVLLSKIGPYKLFYFDIFRTAPGRELESELINAYMKFLERKHNTSSAEKVLCIDSFGMSAVWQKKIPRFKWDPTDFITLYVIVNDNHHWFVVVSVCISSIKTQFISNSFALIKVLKSPSQIIFPKLRKSLPLDSLGESSQKLMSRNIKSSCEETGHECEVGEQHTSTSPTT